MTSRAGLDALPAIDRGDDDSPRNSPWQMLRQRHRLRFRGLAVERFVGVAFWDPFVAGWVCATRYSESRNRERLSGSARLARCPPPAGRGKEIKK